MVFGDTPVADAGGAILAHTIKLPGTTLHKGAVLDAAALAALVAPGITHILAARPEADDVGEDEAARRVATALSGAALHSTRPHAGRANLMAAHPGLFRAERVGIDALNLLDERIVVATLPDATVVAAGDLVATVKIIPFAVPRRLLQLAEELARQSRDLFLSPLAPLVAGLVVTELPGLKDSVVRGTIEATAARVEKLGGRLLPVVRVPHKQDGIAAALSGLIEQGAQLLLVAGATATVDRADVAPAAVVAIGGTISRFGMPVDPGNLICVGQLGRISVLILPGRARSPAANGIDLVLCRIFAGDEVTSGVIAGMGVGGLLKEVARPISRSGRPAVASGEFETAAIVLAAGLSSRMAPQTSC